MSYAHNIRQLIKANAGTLKSNGRIIKRESGLDNLVLEIVGQDCNIYVQGTEPTLREWVNNFVVPRLPFKGSGELEIGFMLNIDGLVGGKHELRSLISLCMTLNGKINFFANSRGCPIAKGMALSFFQLGIPKHRISLELYGCPRSGDSEFKRAYNAILGDKTTTINGRFDLFTFVPPWGNQHGQIVKIFTGISHRLIDYLRAVERMEAKQ